MKGALASPGLLKGEPQSQQMKGLVPAKASAAVGNAGDVIINAFSYCSCCFPTPPPPPSVHTHPPIHPTVLFLFHLDPHYGAASRCKSKETLRLGCYGNMETVQGFEGSSLLNLFGGDETGTGGAWGR